MPRLVVRGAVMVMPGSTVIWYWLFPAGSFDDEPGVLNGTPVPAMSMSGMLAMKEQYPQLRNGGPWRQKDIGDIETLRELAARGGPRPLQSDLSYPHHFTVFASFSCLGRGTMI